MKKIFVIFFLAIILTACGNNDIASDLTAGNSEDKSVKVTFDVTSHADGAETTYDTQTPDLKVGDKITFEYGMTYVFTLEKIEDDNIVLSCDSALSTSTDPDAGTDMKSKQKEFTINKGETVYLKTLTYDAGQIFAVKYN